MPSWLNKFIGPICFSFVISLLVSLILLGLILLFKEE